MEYVPLGKTGLVTSVIGLGGGSSGRFGLAKGGTRADAVRLIHTALDHGITFFDGAGICGGVDELLAAGLANRRDDVVLSTKVHLGPDPYLFSAMRLPNQASSWAARRFGLVCSGQTIRKRVEQTLKALRTDRIDLLHLHAVTPRQFPLATALILPELAKMKAEGKIRAIGITEGFLTDARHAMLRQAIADERVDAVMTGFNVANPSAAESVIPAAAKRGVGVIGMFALRGVLGSNKLQRLVDDAGASLSNLAYRYARHQAGMDVVLTGTGDSDHLRQNIAAVLSRPLSDSVLDRLRALALPPA